MANYALGTKSLKELEGVNDDLIKVVKRAIELTAQDFSVHDGIRTIDDQKKLVASGASKTMNSRHITGNAVDLVPYINGRLRWEWEPIYIIADAVRTAANEFDVPLRWGGCWDVTFTETDASPEDLVEDYVARRRAAGKRAFIDGPHFELPRSERYP
ncbi:Phage endolysin [hydrothermal vent metagenome]|uniref:Phage endolysin n=1 Tax=hydrothermal vent metagenome TaxID=652676 RepID=A0A3B0ZUA5_9ZZZZ